MDNADQWSHATVKSHHHLDAVAQSYYILTQFRNVIQLGQDTASIFLPENIQAGEFEYFLQHFYSIVESEHVPFREALTRSPQDEFHQSHNRHKALLNMAQQPGIDEHCAVKT